MKYIIRAAEQDDINTIIALCVEHAAYEQIAFSPEGKAEKLGNFLFADNPPLFCLVAEQKGEVVGYATYMFEFSTWDAAFYLHMDCLYLVPHARGFGLGEMMMKKLAAIAKENNCSVVQWHTPPFNERAIKFYNRLGTTAKKKVRFYLDEKNINQL